MLIITLWGSAASLTNRARKCVAGPLLLTGFLAPKVRDRNKEIHQGKGSKLTNQSPIAPPCSGLIAGFMLLVGFLGGSRITPLGCVFSFLVIHFTTVNRYHPYPCGVRTAHPRFTCDGPPMCYCRRCFGMRRLGARSLTLFSLVYCFNRAYRGNAMPHQLEALKTRRAHGGVVPACRITPYCLQLFSVH